MKKETLSVRHPRLDAYYHSTVLNFAMIVLCLALMTMRYPNCFVAVWVASVAFIFFVAYSVWFWTGRKKTVGQSSLVSGIASGYVYYFLIVAAIKVPSMFCIVFAYIAAVATVLIYLFQKRKQQSC